ncbi:PDR/VanB family oxidoreductase [Conexibacter stalactiti]|uniref:PDR/VanB family oxidoreductase n=1 Tax=Conexibacter stalactiti TaxID=1940611 RepID=A0ABU4HVY1_9ACTN|nr:PDR/VanB family oxidoreductase [Conexibacter stalactiti]MDW5596999.1 PDR/VanB family oxidoreductase [Conexibacter stalactiti]MEC5037641.1 PDR/VanB family oxidoreductase [Conexibacter stalactiti]
MSGASDVPGARGPGDPREAIFEVVVTQLTYEADAVVSVRLERPDGAPLPAWEPGAHVDLLLPVGITRQYSLIESPPDFSSYTIAVLQQPNSRGGSEYVHVFLRPGQRVALGAPRNHFALDPAPHYLFLGGGIGITPLLSMVRAAALRRARWSLHYGGRSVRSMAFAQELVAAHGDAVRLWPADERGPLPLGELLRERADDTLLYCCGPAPLLSAVQEQAERAGWPREAIHFERFAPTVHAHGPDLPVTVVARRSGVEVLVEEDESLLDGLARAGVSMASSCRAGVCGACQATVLDGVPDHRDDVLTPAQREAGDVMMPCVSRARGERIVLDV